MTVTEVREKEESSNRLTFPSKAFAAQSPTSGLGPFTVPRRTPRAQDVQIEVLYDAIYEISGDPGIGLKLGSEERIERYDPIAIAAVYARSFRDALDRMARYKRLTCPEEIRIAERGDECAVQFMWLLAETTEPSTLIDICFAWVVTVGRRGIGRDIKPLRVEFQRPEAN